jgi:predicted aminopeptidase
MHATSTNSEVDRRLKAACDEELRLENQHLVMVRRAKLKQLYASDRVKWEKALARAGLAICYDD